MSSLCFAFVVGGSNLGFTGYLQFEDFRSYVKVSEHEIDKYRTKAKEYVNNCDNDIERILEAREDAIKKANTVIKEWNDGLL